MADRKVHYEAAFEELLRRRGIPYVAVDEAKKALFSQAALKSFDFVVYGPSGRNLLVDIKGRSAKGGLGFQTWVTETDVSDLMQWEVVFGQGFTAVLVFAYEVDPPLAADEGLFEHKSRWYRMLGVELSDYRNGMRRRSEKWKTVSLPMEAFRSLARPFTDWISCGP